MYEVNNISEGSTCLDETDKSTWGETMKLLNLKSRILDCVAEGTISRPDSLNSLNGSDFF